MPRRTLTKRESDKGVKIEATPDITFEAVSNHLSDIDRSIFTSEDPRVMPFSDSDIDLLNRIENENYFGKRY